ncbi:DUF1315 family protein [Paraneptunicella aestuarii]|uniref:YeaC family protein n=1 Tax=Paraneptunicella aestuarii TaxID=2831148 RepID=UPI001E4EA550|nr:DUF1315 family protein [Paraneptunicella aestuarii]UAA40437.1 DUF1315 family protein [Paraneptunicella aestuarii]
MNVEQLVQSMTEDTYEKLSSAVETGKWPDGTKLTDEQLASSMQAVMLYQSKVMNSQEHFTIGSDGEIVNKSKDELKKQFSEQPIARFKQDDF